MEKIIYRGIDPTLVDQDVRLIDIFLAEVSQYPPIDPKKNAKLGELIIAGKKAAEELSHSEQNDEIVAELNRIIDCGKQAEKDLAILNLPLAVHFASSVCKSRGISFEEAVSAANVGLMEAIHHFDPTKGSFSTIAFYWMRQAVARYAELHLIPLPAHFHKLIKPIKLAIAQAENLAGHSLNLTERTELIYDLLMSRSAGKNLGKANLGRITADNKEIASALALWIISYHTEDVESEFRDLSYVATKPDRIDVEGRGSQNKETIWDIREKIIPTLLQAFGKLTEIEKVIFLTRADSDDRLLNFAEISLIIAQKGYTNSRRKPYTSERVRQLFSVALDKIKRELASNPEVWSELNEVGYELFGKILDVPTRHEDGTITEEKIE